VQWQSISPCKNVLVAFAVLAAHITALAAVSGLSTCTRTDITSQRESQAVTTGFVMERAQADDVVPIAEAALAIPRAHLSSLQVVRFESTDWGDVSDVVSRASAPQLSRFQPVDPAAFARRAGLPPGQSASTVLTVEVLVDGRTGTVEISRGSGDAAVDRAALAYALLLRWIPGTRDRRAQAMRVSLPVTLVWNPLPR